MKTQTYLILILLGLSLWFGVENYKLRKNTDNPATLDSYLEQIVSMKKTVDKLTNDCLIRP